MPFEVGDLSITTFRASSADVTDELLAEVVRDIAEVNVDDGQRHGVHLTSGQGALRFSGSYAACPVAFNVHWQAQRAPNAVGAPGPRPSQRVRGTRIGPNTDLDDRIASKQIRKNR